MKKVVKVKTANGQTVKVFLDHWGAGTDSLHRRWTLQPEGWLCAESGEFAQGLDTLVSRLMKLWHARRS